MSIMDKVKEYLSDSFKNGDRVIIKGKESGKNIWATVVKKVLGKKILKTDDGEEIEFDPELILAGNE